MVSFSKSIIKLNMFSLSHLLTNSLHNLTLVFAIKIQQAPLKYSQNPQINNLHLYYYPVTVVHIWHATLWNPTLMSADAVNKVHVTDRWRGFCISIPWKSLHSESPWIGTALMERNDDGNKDQKRLRLDLQVFNDVCSKFLGHNERPHALLCGNCFV